MKRLKFVCCASLILCTSSAVHARPARHGAHVSHSTASSIARLLQSYYNRADAATDRKDLDGATRYFSQDFTMTDHLGSQIDLGEVRFRLSALFDMAKSIRGFTSVSAASQHGNIATALIHESSQCIVVNPDTGKRGVLVDHSVARDTWTHTEDGWMMTSSQQISSQETLNGRPVVAPADPAPDPNQGGIPPQGYGVPGGGDDNSG